MKPRLAIGCDHGALEMKKFLFDNMVKEGYEIIDCGTYTSDSCHYPLYALKVAEKIKNQEVDYGIVCCTTGEGVCIAANKVHHVRCGLCYNDDVAHLIKEHNNANCIAFGAKYTSNEQALTWLETFLNAQFMQGRHAVRVDIISEYEDEHSN